MAFYWSSNAAAEYFGPTSWRPRASSTAWTVAVRLDRDERGAAHLLGADHPAGKLGGQRGLAFTALAAHHGVAFGPQQPLEREQFPAAPDEAGFRFLR